MRMNVGIIGITGYTGIELVRLVAQHPELSLVHGAAGASAGQSLTSIWPSLTGLIDLTVESVAPSRIIEICDVVFLALPHGHAATLAPELIASGVTVIDLGADFRLKSPATYARYYGLEHPSPGLLDEAVYGLPELHRSALKGARLVANPGCYPTAVTLAAHPLLSLVTPPLVASCLSGVSGAGRGAPERTRYCETADQARAYAVGGVHRHTPEIEQNLRGAQVTFTPHLVPMSRGIVATVHMRHEAPIDPAALQGIYADAYADEPMIVLRGEPPSTGDVRGSNRAHLHVCHDPERQMTTAICVIDNLLKGAAGQAVQALNAVLGLPETTGLPLHPAQP
jgi:N-acetyl-gamma-glutamyl-phosphate reductase